MKLSTLVLVWLSTDGYWFGGGEAAVRFQWAVCDGMPAATFAWRLQTADLLLAEGQGTIAQDATALQSEIKLPTVRVPIEAKFDWRVDRATQQKTNPQKTQESLAQGVIIVHLYPSTLLAGQAKLLAGKQLMVWDSPDGLPALLAKEQIRAQVVHNESDLAFERPDILIVAANCLNGQAAWPGQQRVMNLAAAGTNVLILAQSGSVASRGHESFAERGKLVGYSLTKRRLPRKLKWREGHPLARSLRLMEQSDAIDIAGSPELSAGMSAWAIRVPAGDPALEIAWWPPDVLGRTPVTSDALVVSKAVQKGRITMCQMKLGPWQSDPRSQLFLANALDYLVSPVVPTPPTGERVASSLPTYKSLGELQLTSRP